MLYFEFTILMCQSKSLVKAKVWVPHGDVQYKHKYNL